jgi:hypothetical protein
MSTATSTPTALVLAPPRSESAPTISGHAVVGATLKGSSGSWSGTKLAFAYAWIRCRTSCLGGKTVGRRLTYTPRAADRGSRIELVVNASNDLDVVRAASRLTRRIRRATERDDSVPEVGASSRGYGGPLSVLNNQASRDLAVGEVVDLHVRLPVVAVPYPATLLEHGIRLVKHQDPRVVRALPPPIWVPRCGSPSRGYGLAAIGPLSPGVDRGQHGCGYVRLRNKLARVFEP